MGKTYWQSMVAVSALIWRAGREILFLHRVQPPRIWVPPGGRVEAGESPFSAVQREIREETGLEDVIILAPCIVEAGLHDGIDILYIDHVCQYQAGSVCLNPAEHDGFRWLDMKHLEQAMVRLSVAAGGELLYHYRWGEEELILSHSLEQLRFSLRLFQCLTEEGHSPSV
ncbi:MAG: NUDIX hydrolase [Anaerolineae bacterium]